MKRGRGAIRRRTAAHRAAKDAEIADPASSGGTASPGGRSRAGRPSKPLITRETAAEAALELIDRVGLDALSLQQVAHALGVRAPSLYHHFRDKEALLVEVARCLLVEIDREKGPWDAEWDERAIQLSLSARRVAMRHPNAAPLLLRFFPRRLMLPAYERVLQDCPYPPETHAAILEATEKFAFGAALFAAAAEAHHMPAMPEFDAGHFPLLRRALDSGPGSDEAVHEQALRALLAGLHAEFGAPAAGTKRGAGRPARRTPPDAKPRT